MQLGSILERKIQDTTNSSGAAMATKNVMKDAGSVLCEAEIVGLRT